jgi:prepilin-type N-terminal cleavage/methylation domain-containing protein
MAGAKCAIRSVARGFTLIELLIVVSIIAILAAIAVPNFLEAQTRAKVSTAKADMRSLAIAVETYCLDNNSYPEGTDNPQNYPQRISDVLGALAPGYYTFRTRAGERSVGSAFAGVTTPIAYIATVPADPFAKQAAGFLTYCYRNAKDRNNGWILTSVGPDADLLKKNGIGSTNLDNPLSTALDGNLAAGKPARIGDINERQAIRFMEGDPMPSTLLAGVEMLRHHLKDLTYDPTNGSLSEGDLWRIGP